MRSNVSLLMMVVACPSFSTWWFESMSIGVALPGGAEGVTRVMAIGLLQV